MSLVDGSATAISTFESLLYPMLDSAYRAALNLTRERADADDLVQDATLNSLRRFGGFIPGSHLERVAKEPRSLASSRWRIQRESTTAVGAAVDLVGWRESPRGCAPL